MTLQSDADAQALRAALSVVEDWGSDLSVLFGVDTSSSSGSDDGQPQKVNRKPSRETRAVRRHQIAALKAQVEELQLQVAMAKATGEAKLNEADAIKHAEKERQWRWLASSQQSLRLAAEKKNANLRRRTEFQLKISRQIDKLAKQWTKLEEVLKTVPRAISMAHYRGPRVDPRIQLQRLDEMVRSAHEIFHNDQFSRSGGARFREMHARDATLAEVGVEFEYHALWMLPFAVDRVADAIWAKTNRPAYERKTHAYMDVYRDANSAVSQTIATPATKDWWGQCHSQSASRRLPRDCGDGSVLIVSKTLARAHSDSKCHMTADVEEWLRIERVHTPTSDTGSSPITLVKFYRRILLQLPEEAELSQSGQYNWTQALLADQSQTRLKQDFDWSIDAIDNHLLTPNTSALQSNSPHSMIGQPAKISV